MNKRTSVTLVAGLVLLGAMAFEAAGEDKAPKAGDEKSVNEKGSYAIGLSIGSNFQHKQVDVNFDSLAKGIRDGLANKPQMSEKEIAAALEAFEKSFASKASDKNKQFLADNKKKEGIVTTKSGLQYKVIKDGNGPKPGKTDKVTCHYRGTLIDGKEFDSSYERGEPATFPLGQVIQGWNEALPMMKVGSKWRLFIPSELAYGDRGAPPDIGPNSTLIFDIELLSIGDSNKGVDTRAKKSLD